MQQCAIAMAIYYANYSLLLKRAVIPPMKAAILQYQLQNCSELKIAPPDTKNLPSGVMAANLEVTAASGAINRINEHTTDDWQFLAENPCFPGPLLHDGSSTNFLSLLS